MSWWWLCKRPGPLLSPGVRVEEVDIAVRPIVARPNAAVIGYGVDGPTVTPVYIGPFVRRPRWWAFWRWHQYPRWRRESRAAFQKFQQVFGMPNAPQYYEWPKPPLMATPSELPREPKP